MSKVITYVLIIIYHVTEHLDGEKHRIKIINYNIGEKIKVFCLNHMKG